MDCKCESYKEPTHNATQWLPLVLQVFNLTDLTNLLTNCITIWIRVLLEKLLFP